MIERSSLGILGVGAFLPSRRVTNEDLAALVDTTDAWITSHTGIRERRYAEPDISTSDLAEAAARGALTAAGQRPDDVDLLVVATSSPDWIQPPTAAAVHSRLGLRATPAFDISAVCSGFVYGLAVISGLMSTNRAFKSGLLIGAETFSRFLDFTDRRSCIYFGDGAGAAIVGAVPTGFGLLAINLVSEGRLHDLVKVPAGGARLVASAATVESRQHYFRMDGAGVWAFFTKTMPGLLHQVISEAQLTLDDIDLFVFHQANRVMIEHCLSELGVASDRAHFTIERYGNTAAASIPITLHDAVSAGRLARGKHVILASVGGGMNAGACVLRWY